MKVHRRFGFAATALGAALALSSLVVSQAGAVAVTNPTSHHGNATTCADVGRGGSTLFEGSVHSGVYTTSLIDYTITHHTYVTLTRVDPAITVHAVVVKGGHHYHVYNPPVTSMRSPYNGGDNVPDLSHWYLCYGATPVVTTTSTTTTLVDDTTTTTVVDDTTTTTLADDTTTTTLADDTTTTTLADDTTTTTLADATTTTTVVDIGGPTTSTTTTIVAGGGPTTTLLSGGGGALPRTGSGSDMLLVVGLLMVAGGMLTTVLGRRTVLH
jgi:LPXTG-motif cell wall-anchored protein